MAQDYDIKKQQEKLMDMAKGTVGLGIMTWGGSRLMGAFGNAGGPATTPVVQSTTAALQLVNIGNLANVGMNLLPGQEKKGSKKSTGDNKIDKMLGL